MIMNNENKFVRFQDPNEEKLYNVAIEILNNYGLTGYSFFCKIFLSINEFENEIMIGKDRIYEIFWIAENDYLEI